MIDFIGTVSDRWVLVAFSYELSAQCRRLIT